MSAARYLIGVRALFGGRAARPSSPAVGLAIVTGVLAGVGLGLLLLEQRFATAALALVAGLVLVGLAPRAVATRARDQLRALAGAAYAVHVAVAALLFIGSAALGRGGFITGDDRAYADLAWALAEYIRGRPQEPLGPPLWAWQSYLFGTWVYVETGLFLLFGYEPLVPLVLNASLAIAMGLLVYDMANRLFDQRSALLAATLVFFYPSIVLWSSLNLKEALALTLIAGCLWALLRFHERPRWWFVFLAYATLAPMESLRRYIFVGLTLLIPLAVALAPSLRLRSRLLSITATLFASLGLLVVTQQGATLGPGLLASLEATRHAMTVGARTAFVESTPIPVREGETFVVTVATPGEARDSVSGSTPNVIHVAPGTRVVLVPAGGPTPSPSPRTVYVQPGDVIVVGPTDTSPAPPSQRKPLLLKEDTPATDLISFEQAEGEVAIRTVAYLPRGIVYALFAPFPWSIRRGLDIAPAAEMLAWYVLVAAALVSLWSNRCRWRLLGPIVLFSVGVLLVLALAEGNVGTLYRHRAMVIPFVILLASPALFAVWTRFARGARPVGSGPNVDG